MDPSSLSNLLTTSTSRLTTLYLQLGHPPDLLSSALSALHRTIKHALDAEVAKVQAQVHDAQHGILAAQRSIRSYKAALGDDNAAVAKRHSSSKDTAKGSGEEQALLPRLQSLQAESSRLQSLYVSRKSHVLKLRQQLEGYRPLLGDEVLDGCTPALPQESQTPRAQDEDGAEDDVKPLPTSYLQSLSNALSSCSSELKRRTEELQSHLVEIVQLWSELAYPPDLGPTDQGAATTVKGEETFDARVLRHLRLRPVGLMDGGEQAMQWQGVFEAAPDDGGSSEPSAVDHAIQQETQSQTGGSETPTRCSGSQTTLTLPSYAPPTLPPGTLLPTPSTISLAASKREHLEAEKQRREERIQQLYDELVELWTKFDVQQEEMDAFVAANAGSTRGVVEAYECELLKMLELKSQHMALFISNVRCRIASIWDVMHLSSQERRESFPPFFWDLALGSLTASGGDGNGGPSSSVDGALHQNEDGTTVAEATDGLLAQHETYEAKARDECEKRLPIIRMIAKYRELQQEERELEESAKDTTRLLKGARGDPGRLLREEKSRKRVRTLKPKLEEEMCRAIPEWEEEYGKAFTVDGVRFIDALRQEMPGNASKKRSRTISGASNASVSLSSTPLLGASTAHNRLVGGGNGSGVASTPLRPHTPGTGFGGSGTGTGTKKARTAPPSQAPGSTSAKSAYGRTPMSSSTAAAGSSAKSRPPVSGFGHGNGGASSSRGLSIPGRQGGKMSGGAGLRSATAGGTADGQRSVSRLGRTAYGAQTPSQSSPTKGAKARVGGMAGSMPPPSQASATAGTLRTAFRPRPSALDPVGNVVGLGISATAGPTHSNASWRNGSSRSVLSDNTVVVHPHPQAPPQAPPPQAPQTRWAPPISNQGLNSSSTSRLQRRGPSLSLSGHLAMLSNTGTAYTRPSISGAGCSIRSVSSEDIAGFAHRNTRLSVGRGSGGEGRQGFGTTGGGANWAVLEDEEEGGMGGVLESVGREGEGEGEGDEWDEGEVGALDEGLMT